MSDGIPAHEELPSKEDADIVISSLTRFLC
jgi:hypothetical protein